jgi:hypothetical protein
MTNSEGGESLLSKWACDSPLSLQRSEVRIGAAPGACHSVHFVAFHGVGATTCNYSWGLVRKLIGGIDNLVLQCNFMTNMLTIADLAYLPLFLSHSTPPVYERHCKIIKKRLPVTGVIYWNDKPPIVDET